MKRFKTFNQFTSAVRKRARTTDVADGGFMVPPDFIRELHGYVSESLPRIEVDMDFGGLRVTLPRLCIMLPATNELAIDRKAAQIYFPKKTIEEATNRISSDLAELWPVVLRKLKRETLKAIDLELAQKRANARKRTRRKLARRGKRCVSHK